MPAAASRHRTHNNWSGAQRWTDKNGYRVAYHGKKDNKGPKLGREGEQEKEIKEEGYLNCIGESGTSARRRDGSPLDARAVVCVRPLSAELTTIARSPPEPSACGSGNVVILLLHFVLVLFSLFPQGSEGEYTVYCILPSVPFVSSFGARSLMSGSFCSGHRFSQRHVAILLVPEACCSCFLFAE